jgi:hypothetical protein
MGKSAGIENGIKQKNYDKFLKTHKKIYPAQAKMLF